MDIHGDKASGLSHAIPLLHSIPRSDGGFAWSTDVLRQRHDNPVGDFQLLDGRTLRNFQLGRMNPSLKEIQSCHREANLKAESPGALK